MNRTHLQFCYRAHDRVFQPRDAKFLQASFSEFGEIAAVGRDSPAFLPFEKCFLAECWRAGRTEKLTQVTKSDWTPYRLHFYFYFYFLHLGKTTTVCYLRSQALGALPTLRFGL